MKIFKFILLTLTILISLKCSDNSAENNDPSSLPEKIYEGDVNLRTQIEVDDFASQNYTRINGSLKIIGEPNLQKINNLNSLVSLRYIKSNLLIEQNPELISLMGLNNIKTVGLGLSLYQNSKLINISSLSNLNSIGEYLRIEENSSLTGLTGLNSIKSVTSLTIKHNLKLLDLTSLSNINSLSQKLEIVGNPFITDIDFLNNLYNNSFIDTIIFLGNDNLISLNGLNKVIKVNRISVFGNPKITNLNGLNNLVAIGNIGTSLPSSTTLYIGSNKALNSLQALNKLTYCHGQIDIFSNPQLTTLDGLNNLTDAGGECTITDNIKLRNLCALKSLLSNTIFTEYFQSSGNFYNPTKQNIIAGNCNN